LILGKYLVVQRSRPTSVSTNRLPQLGFVQDDQGVVWRSALWELPQLPFNNFMSRESSPHKAAVVNVQFIRFE